MARLKKLTLLAALLAVIGMLAPAVADAAPVRPAAVNCCTGGSYEGSGSTTLSNGVLTTGFCVYSAHGIATVNDQYQKKAGSTVTVRFAWEFVDSSGSNATGRQYDQGAFSISAGQTKTFQWSYGSPGKYSPSGNAPCFRGVLISGADTFSTRVVC